MSFESGRRLHGVVCALGLAAALSAGACGNQGPPQPPLRSVPATTSDLRLRQQGNRLLLDFSFPQTTAAGQALGGVTSVEVWEVLQPVRPAAPSTAAPAPGTVPDTAPGATPGTTSGTAPGTTAATDGKTTPLDPRIFQAASTKILTLTQQDLPAATFGSRVLIPLPLPEPMPTPPQARYYAVRTVGPLGDLSEFSNQVGIVPGTPPAPPERVSVTARPDGVLVEWSGTDGATGYNIYRRQAEQRSLGQPIQAAGAEARSWLDTSAALGQSYIYGVTAIAGQDPLIESGVASEQEVRYQDRFPPPPPLELVALAEGGRVRLVWRGSEAEDLVGYHVYRRGAEGDFARVSRETLVDTEFVDESVSPGQTYSYRVTAVDKLGNESGPGAEVRASVPE